MSALFLFNAPAPSAQGFAKLPARGTLRNLWPYIWPSGRPDLAVRIFACLALLLAGKVTTIAIPYSFKWATDALSDPARAPLSSLIAGPLGFTLLYGALRLLFALFY